MADVTRIQDIIDPEVLADQVSAKYPDMLVLGNSSLVEVDSTFPLGSPSTEFKMPFWKRIGKFATMAEGTALVPGRVTAGAEYATVQRAGAAYEVYDTAELVSKADPTSEISSQISRVAAEWIDDSLVAEVEKTPNVFDQTGLETSGTMTQNAIINALISTLGDNYAKMLGGGRLVMHSKCLGDLMQLGVIQNQYQAGMETMKTGMLPYILGLPITVSDRVTTEVVSTVTKYKTYIVGPGSLALFFQRSVKVEFDRDILLQADVIAATVHFAAHLFGWDDKTNAQAAEDAKSIHAVTITSN